MPNWIQRFLTAIATHKADASAHHAKTTSLGDITDHNLAAHGLGAVVPHDALASLTEKAHGSLTGVTSDQHHAQAHTLGSHSTKAHTELTGVTSDQHHPQSHNAASHSDIASTGANIDDAVAKKHAQNSDTDLSPAHKDAATGVHGVGAGTIAKVADIAVDANLSVAAQDAITKRHAEAHTLASHSTKAHAELTGVTSDQHHPQSHNAASHSDIASSGANIDDAVTKKHAQNSDTDLSPAHKDAATGVHGVGAGTIAEVADIAVDANLSVAAQDAITKRHAEAHTLASHSTKAHAELSDAPADAHHPQSHNAASHSDIASSGADIDDAVSKKHARQHALDAAADHTGSITDAQHGVRSTANAHAHGALSGVTADQHHPQSHNAASHSDIASSGANIDDAVTKRHTQNTDTDLSPAHKDAATGVHGVGAGTIAKVADIAVDANLSVAAQDAITKRHAEAHTLASHSTKAHAELTGVTSDQHHTKTPENTIELIASDTLRNSNDTERSRAQVGSYTKTKETLLNDDLAVCRIKMAIETGYFKIYKNGAPIGTERTGTGSYVVHSEDFSGFVSGDLIQIYGYHSGATWSCKDFRFYFTKQVTHIGGEPIPLTTPLEINLVISTTNQDP